MFYLIDIHYMVPYTGRLKNVLSCIITQIRGYVYKVLGINSAILLPLYSYDEKSKILIFFKIYYVNGQQPNFQELLCYHLLSSHKSLISNKQVHNFRA